MYGDAYAQRLSLGDAIGRAESHAFATRGADAEARARAAEALLPARGILPSARIEAAWARTTDPIGAFGTTLRQRVITQADFDPQRLNHPAAVSNYGASLILEQPLLNTDAHIARRAALRASDAAHAQATWVRSGTGVAVVQAYFGGALASEHVATLEAALAAAQAHVRRAELMAEQGIVTKSDAMLARVKRSEIEAQLVEARADARLVTTRVALLLGSPSDTLLELPSALPGKGVLERLAGLDWHAAEGGRPDVAAAAAGSEAARLNAARARAALLPRINAMARYDWNSPDAPFRGDENWSVGVVASWSVFGGGSDIGDIRAADARAAAARSQLDGARAQADLERSEAENAWSVAAERLALAEQSVDQAAEAHRITARMYAGGLATVTELLGAAAVETETRLRLSVARYELISAAARRLHALGRSVRELPPFLHE